MPPPHHMSPSPSPVDMELPARISSPAPVPPPPVIVEEATTETSATSETSSETAPAQSAALPKDYAYHASKLRERDERQFQRSITPTPLSPGSTRISDYGIVSSPQVDPRKMKAPAQAHHFEIEKGTTMREKLNRSWSSRMRKEVTRTLTVTVLFRLLLTGYRSLCLLHLSGVPAPHRFLLLLLWRIRLSPHDRGNQENLRCPECPRRLHLRPHRRLPRLPKVTRRVLRPLTGRSWILGRIQALGPVTHALLLVGCSRNG